MLSHGLKSVLIIFVLSVCFLIEGHSENLSGNGRDNYILLKRMYGKWDSGLFGSRKYYRKRLYRLLTDMIGADIQTAQDYRISIPDVFEKKYYSSDLYNQNWLHIHGAADNASIKVFEEKGNNYIKEVERNRYLFFLSGRIERFRIIETSYGRNIHLYLESVKITDSVK